MFKKKQKSWEDAAKEFAKERGFRHYFFYGIAEENGHNRIDQCSEGNSLYLMHGHIKMLEQSRQDWPTVPVPQSTNAS